jgi:hypothetical protein
MSAAVITAAPHVPRPARSQFQTRSARMSPAVPGKKKHQMLLLWPSLAGDGQCENVHALMPRRIVFTIVFSR